MAQVDQNRDHLEGIDYARQKTYYDWALIDMVNYKPNRLGLRKSEKGSCKPELLVMHL